MRRPPADKTGGAGSALRDAAAWTALMRARLDPVRPCDAPDCGADETAAAVLAPLVLREGELHVILTVRPDTLPRHAGQICFPGGRIHHDDADAAAAALRETHEEIGVAPHSVDLLGRWEAQGTGQGFRVTPFAGLVDPAAALAACPREVAEIFEAPFAFLMDPANHSEESMESAQGVRRFSVIRYGDYTIWGATAAMLRALWRRLDGAPDALLSGRVEGRPAE